MRMLTPMNWAPRGLVTDLFDDLDQFFEGFDRSSSVYDERSYMPAVEVTESDEHFLVSFDVPGMKTEDIKIEMNGNLLTVSGERKREIQSDKNAKVQRLERSYGFFKRSFTLPQSVDGEKIEASYENGVLQVFIPKAQAARPRKIEIRSEKGGLMNRILGSRKEKEVTSTEDKAHAS